MPTITLRPVLAGAAFIMPPMLPAGSATQTPLSPRRLFLLALCAGAAVANLYYAQPLLAEIAATFHSPTRVGVVTVATQIGYTLGILFLLPLGDLTDRRHLCTVLAGMLVLAQLGCALAPSLALLAVVSLFVGIGACITQMLIPFAADLSAPERRGHAVGTVFSGVLAGILLARTLSGILGQWLGWRGTLAIAGLIALWLGISLRVALPRQAPKTSQRYGALLLSMWGLLRRHRPLQIACAIQACLFAIFSAFWSLLALLLASPRFGYGAAAAGTFGVIGLVGVVTANRSGRLIERFGRNRVLLAALGCCVLAYVIFTLNVSLPGLIMGIVLLDFGLSLANVSNQSMIFGLDAQARSRINSIYVTAIFFGGAVGAGAASIAWAHRGWLAVCVLGLAIAIFALSIHLIDWATRSNDKTDALKNC